MFLFVFNNLAPSIQGQNILVFNAKWKIHDGLNLLQFSVLKSSDFAYCEVKLRQVYFILSFMSSFVTKVGDVQVYNFAERDP